jgi:Zn-finger nucleic acid-binding protein
MDCPKCNVELQLEEDDQVSLARCTQCTGIWLDVADLNRVLLRHNLPGLEKLGGHANPEELAGQCPQCQVDLVTIEGGHKRSLRYDMCESCGGVWLTRGLVDEASLPAMVDGMVDFYKRFAATN